MERVVPHDALGVALSYFPCRAELLESLFDPNLAPTAVAAAVFEDAVVVGHDLWVGQGPLNRSWPIVIVEDDETTQAEGSMGPPDIPSLLKASLAYDPSRRLALSGPSDEDGELLIRLNAEIPLENVDLSSRYRVVDAIGGALQRFTSLVRLNVSAAKFDDTSAANLVNCRSLAELVLVGTRITAASGVHFAALSKTLQFLDVSESYIDDTFFAPLAEATMPVLESLWLLNCSQTTGTCAIAIATFRSLKNLKMGMVLGPSWRASGMTSETFGTAAATDLAKLPRLEELWVPQMHGGDATIAELLPLAPRLTSLNLLRHKITDGVGVALAQYTHLVSLTLAHCVNISDEAGIHLGTLTALELLDLEGCKLLTNNIAPHFLSLRSLTLVILNGCPNVDVKAAEILEPLPKLENVLVDFSF